MRGVWAKAREFSGRIGRAYRTVADVVEPAGRQALALAAGIEHLPLSGLDLGLEFCDTSQYTPAPPLILPIHEPTQTPEAPHIRFSHLSVESHE